MCRDLFYFQSMSAPRKCRSSPTVASDGCADTGQRGRYASCIILRLEKWKEPENLKKLHVGGVDGISCQHLQVVVTNLLQKHWVGMARRKNSHDETWQSDSTNNV